MSSLLRDTVYVLYILYVYNCTFNLSGIYLLNEIAW